MFPKPHREVCTCKFLVYDWLDGWELWPMNLGSVRFKYQLMEIHVALVAYLCPLLAKLPTNFRFK